MTADYKIKIEHGGVSITQHVDAGASFGSTTPKPAGGTLTVLGTTFAACKATAATGGAGRGGDPSGSLGSGGDPSGSLGSGGDPSGSLGSGGDPSGSLGSGGGTGQGQIVVFGPVVVDATGLIHKYLTEQRAEEQHEEK